MRLNLSRKTDQKKDTLVSVIIPVYNVQPYLREALDSVLGQSYQDLEIIMIDDGSTDGSGKICDEYARKDERIRVIHQENKGLSSARNAGLDVMTGDAVAFLDPDDAYHPDFIRAMVRTMNREEADLVLCRFSVYDRTGRPERKTGKKVYPVMESGAFDGSSALRELAENRMNRAVWNKLSRRELWNGIRFPEGHVYEDISVIYRIIYRCEKVFVLDQSLYYHRRRPGSISGNCSEKNVRDWIRAYSGFERFVRDHTPDIFLIGQLEEVRRSILAGMIVFYARFLREQRAEGTGFAHRLRKLILKTGRSVGIRNCSLKTRAGYCMVCLCPRILMASYFVYETYGK